MVGSIHQLKQQSDNAQKYATNASSKLRREVGSKTKPNSGNKGPASSKMNQTQSVRELVGVGEKPSPNKDVAKFTHNTALESLRVINEVENAFDKYRILLKDPKEEFEKKKISQPCEIYNKNADEARLLKNNIAAL